LGKRFLKTGFENPNSDPEKSHPENAFPKPVFRGAKFEGRKTVSKFGFQKTVSEIEIPKPDSQQGLKTHYLSGFRTARNRYFEGWAGFCRFSNFGSG
jgi:hypothetical protein